MFVSILGFPLLSVMIWHSGVALAFYQNVWFQAIHHSPADARQCLHSPSVPSFHRLSSPLSCTKWTPPITSYFVHSVYRLSQCWLVISCRYRLQTSYCSLSPLPLARSLSLSLFQSLFLSHLSSLFLSLFLIQLEHCILKRSPSFTASFLLVLPFGTSALVTANCSDVHFSLLEGRSKVEM